MKPQQHRGITLIELVVGLAVMAVLGALALPTLAARLEQQRLSAAAEMLAADIQEARFEAARRGGDMHLLMQPGAAWCWAVATRSACPCGQAQACELRAARQGDHAGVLLVQGHSLRLLANGQAASTAAALLESRSGAQLRVELQALGRARICAPSGQNPRYPPC